MNDAVALMMNGSFADYVTVSAKHVFPVPAATPESVALLTSGLTASIALEQAGRMGTGETVLVTAAAGGTGQFVVQLAKIAGATSFTGQTNRYSGPKCHNVASNFVAGVRYGIMQILLVFLVWI